MEVIRYVTPCALVDRMYCLGGTRCLLYLWRNSHNRGQADAYTAWEEHAVCCICGATAIIGPGRYLHSKQTNKQTNKHKRQTSSGIGTRDPNNRAAVDLRLGKHKYLFRPYLTTVICAIYVA